MHQSINVYAFRDAFRSAGRGEQFSYEGLGALFEYLEELEESIGEPYELDVISLCCDFSEHESSYDCAVEHGWEPPVRDEDESDEEYTVRCQDDALEALQDATAVIEFNGGIIIQNY